MLIKIAMTMIVSIFAQLSVDEMVKSAHVSLLSDDMEIYIAQDGPLNFARGYIYKKYGLVSNKRLLSPGFRIHTTVTTDNRETDILVGSTKRGIHEFEGRQNERNIKEYLVAYHKALRAMYDVVDGEVCVETERDQSLYKLLSQGSGKEYRYKLLAAMILLAEGLPVPLGFYRNPETGIEMLVCQGHGFGSFFSIRFDIVDNKIEHDLPYAEYTITSEHNDIVDIIKLFIEYGGNNKEKLSFFGLDLNDTLGFLIQSYVFEFIQNLDEAKQLFEAVMELLEYTGNSKDGEKWRMFFTKNKNEIVRFEPIYKTLQEFDNVVSGLIFPFSSCASIWRRAKKYGYHSDLEIYRKSVGFQSNLLESYESILYTLFCCLLYDPCDGRYKLDHLRRNKRVPMESISYFFENVCPRPVERVTQQLQDEWSQIFRELKTECLDSCQFMGKEIDSIDLSMINILKMMTRMLGMPEQWAETLEEIINGDEAEHVEEDHVVLRESLIEYAIDLFQDISVMQIEVEFNNETANMDSQENPFGMTLEFMPTDDMFVLDPMYTVSFNFSLAYVETVISLKNIKMNLEYIGFLENLMANCRSTETALGRFLVENAERYINKNGFRPVPLEYIKDIEQSERGLKRYMGINKLLMTQKIETIDEKLYIVDLFGPYLESIVGRKEETGLIIQRPNEFADNDDILPLSRFDPVVQLITNIIGSVPSGYEVTLDIFAQILEFCGSERKRLFPHINCSIRTISGTLWSSQLLSYEYLQFDSLFKRVHKHILPNTVFKIYKALSVFSVDTFFRNTYGDYAPAFLYREMAVILIKARHQEGIEALKDLYGIRGGVIQSGDYVFRRVYDWFIISLEANFIEGVKMVLDSWMDLSILNGFNSVSIFFIKGLGVTTFKLSNSICSNLCTSEDATVKLLKVCTCFMRTEVEAEMLYELFTTNCTESICRALLDYYEHVLINELGNIFNMNISLANYNAIHERVVFLRVFVIKVDKFLESRRDDISIHIAAAFVDLFEHVNELLVYMENHYVEYFNGTRRRNAAAG